MLELLHEDNCEAIVTRTFREFTEEVVSPEQRELMALFVEVVDYYIEFLTLEK